MLHYPGQEPRRYGSEKAAFNQRRKYELTGTREPQVRKWSPEEDRLVRQLWGTLTRAEYEARLPGRTYFAIKAYCRDKGIRAQTNAADRLWVSSRNRRGVWTAEEIRIVIENTRQTATTLLAGRRTATQVRRLACHLGLLVGTGGRGWTDDETVLVRSIERSLHKLRTTHGRSDRQIATKRARLRRADARVNEAIDAIARAVAHLPPNVRRDVEGELLVRLLSREIGVADLATAVREAVRKTYGPRFLSLDTPIFDGSSATMIDTIASDRMHF